MPFENRFFVAHRKHHIRACGTIEVRSAAHAAYLRANDDRIAKSLHLIRLGDHLFQVQYGHDLESIMQALESDFSAFDEAVANGA